MIPTTSVIPSVENVENYVVETNAPWSTHSAPFYFNNEDGCGVLTDFDITAFDFKLTIYDEDCEVDSYLSPDLVKVSPNILYINIDNLDVPFGEYTYKIKMIGYNSVISGKLKILS